jgi:NADPH-dependent 2,4-dienoyl-CoA reductase/sulfur reductase-like enzyme
MSADNVTPVRRISRHKVVVIGGGFAGMAVDRALRSSDAAHEFTKSVAATMNLLASNLA